MVPKVHNFGKVKLWNNPHAHYTFTNESAKRVLFLPIPYQRNLYVNLPEGYIKPGQTVEIEAVYYTEDLGNFMVEQPLYLSGWDEPVYLRMKGKIQSFHPDAHIACPNMGQEKKEVATAQTAKIVVKDKETGELLTGVDILLTGTSSNYFMEKTRKTTVSLKKMPIGLYEVEVSKAGYQPGKQLEYINNNTGTIVVELERNPYEVVEEEKPSEEEEEDHFVEIEKPKESDEDAIERLRKIMNERFKDRKIIERDVVVLKEPSDSNEIARFEEPDTTSGMTEEEQKEVDTTPKEDFAGNGELNPEKYASNNVVFLIDESSSMMLHNKMDMLKLSMKKLVEVLRPQDRVTIIVYSRRAEVRLESTPGDRKKDIYAVIDKLEPGGRSYGAEGLALSYKYARENFIVSGNNQIILATDGMFNSPNFSNNDMYAMATDNAMQGVLTTVVGFGRDQNAIDFMQELSSNGQGSFIYIKTPAEAEQAILGEVMRNALR